METGNLGPRDRIAPQFPELLALSGRAYQLAVRVLGSAADAEDAVQQAYLNALQHPPGGLPPGKLQAWFLRVVANAAKRHLRGEARRERREAAVTHQVPAGTGAAAEREDLVAALRSALESLDPKYRLPLALCCEQGLSQEEAAEILEIPTRTLSYQVSAGLEQLREKLKRAGYTAAPAAVIGGLAHTAPPVPATLAAALTKLFADGAGVAGMPVGAQHAAPLHGMSLLGKGGLIVKIGLGIAAAGLVAGGAFWAVGGKSEEPAKPKAPSAVEGPAAVAEKKSKFDIPVWHPDARWEVPKEQFANNTLLPGVLDGPRREVMEYSVSAALYTAAPTLTGGFVGSGRYVFESYDARTERFHPATRGARGNLDGPFSRARFSFGDYHDQHMHVRAPGGRFFYMVASWWTGKVRALDFATQTVSTLPVKGCAVAADGESGKVYVVNGTRPVSEVAVLSPGPEWKALETRPLQGNQFVDGLGFVLAVDEKRGRLYGRTAYSNNPWYVWYWDLKDGSYHGLLPLPVKDEPGTRPQGEAGPFKGTKLYGHGEIGWGPDDPEKRYLYMANVDDASLYRLNLDKEVLMVFNGKEGRFVDSGKGTFASYGRMPFFFADGSFVGGVPTYPGMMVRLFPRVK